ncbi:uncharacterized protein P884DRAFT_212232 [Thermothelomyces heterothallicus CBS 202.75]|uniref:uncharacterized protein n=1 Tax=Thermothelomyces heterothallicus CBS 202.75 TaxID=1149848 RepID=UPI003744A046
MEQGVHTHKGHKKAGHPHLVPKPETGYTDEAAEECHDLIDQAEEAAHLHDPDSMYSTTNKPEHVHRATGGLQGSVESAGSASKGAAQKMQETGKGVAQKMQETGKGVSETVGQKVDQMKKTVGLEK